MKAGICFAGVLLVVSASVIVAQRTGGAAESGSARTLTIVTEPGAVLWLDEIRRGTTDNTGRLFLAKVSSGSHNLRVRANGFRELTLPVSAAARGEIKVRLLRTTDRAELAFQQAESARESARDDAARQQAADLYHQALRIRQAFPAAHVGLARLLLDSNDTDGALAAIEAARRYRPNYPEASAVEGRVYRETGQTAEAIGSFNRAIRESRGFQPEAHVGIGRVYEERASTIWPHTNSRSRSTSWLTLNLSSTNCSVLLTKRVAKTKRPSSRMKTICAWLPTARWRRRSARSLSN